MTKDLNKKELTESEELFWYRAYFNYINMFGNSVFTTREKGALFCFEFKNQIPLRLLTHMVHMLNFHGLGEKNEWLEKVEAWLVTQP